MWIISGESVKFLNIRHVNLRDILCVIERRKCTESYLAEVTIKESGNLNINWIRYILNIEFLFSSHSGRQCLAPNLLIYYANQQLII